MSKDPRATLVTQVQRSSALIQLSEAEQHHLRPVLMASPWVAAWFERQSDASTAYQQLRSPPQVNAIEETTRLWQVGETTDAEVMRALRVWRNTIQAQLIAQDVWQQMDVRRSVKILSDLADTAIRVALDWATASISARNGQAAIDPNTQTPQSLLVVGMGKLGAQELNLSSDIDLIFAYPTAGETTQGRPHEQYFTRVGQKLIQLLDARTADGFVFRVDMRLRPWGQSGALVSSLNQLQNYYLQHGRFWERFAWVKARVITGARSAQAALEDIRQPFVYRRYIDFQAVGALRDLKQKIQQEVRRQALGNNIKLGEGGIREAEFIAQVFQLVRGGEDIALQTRSTWKVFEYLRSEGLLPPEVADDLSQGYQFLRTLEHRIQGIQDTQTQTLPSDPLDLERLTVVYEVHGQPDWLNQLQAWRDKIHQHFQAVIEDVEPENQPQDLSDECNALVERNFHKLPESELADVLREFCSTPGVQRLADAALDNWNALLPVLWRTLHPLKDGAERFRAIQPILDAVLRRSSYFALLAENPGAVNELVKLVPASPWMAKQLTDMPFLLDELTNTADLYRLPSRVELADELQQLLIRVPEDDLERQMEVLRHFRHERVLRAAACEITQLLPLMKISDYLAWVAEVVVEQSLNLAWQQMVAKHGRPRRTGGDWCEKPFGVVAYGKFGGIELSYESDLDLVFLHDADSQGQTKGPKVIDNSVFVARLGQKLIHLLSAITPSGQLYEVDTRLRPSGQSGLLVSSLAAFERYQKQQAWTWEHQALVRARFVAGDPAVKAQFELIRKEVLSQTRDEALLKQQVTEMRAKMRSHLSSAGQGKTEQFHFKQDPGGIVDLEFLVQFLVLRDSGKHAELLAWPDNVRLLKSLVSCQVMEKGLAERLTEAYLVLRQAIHHAVLSQQDIVLPESELPPGVCDARADVMAAWRQFGL